MSYLNKSYPNLRDAFPRSPGGETKDEAAIAISAHQARAGDVAISSSAEEGREPSRWQQEANCLGQDPDLFHPSDYQSADNHAQVAAAKIFCNSCVVRDKCLDFALETKQGEGIWGGMTPPERGRILRRSS
jgi:WhiB family redox-sensing transcriptional regulator